MKYLTGESVSVVVNGESGFIGSHFRIYSELHTLDYKQGNLEGASNILHFIGTTDNYHIFTDPYLDLKTNNFVLIKYLEEFRERCPNAVFNFISTWFVYGKSEPPFHENTPCKPIGLYSVTKYAAEMIVETYCKTFGLNYRIIRLANVVGKGDKGTSQKKNVLQYVINQLKNNQPVDLYKNGKLIRDFIHVIDVVRGLDLILQHGEVNEVYNLGSGKIHRMSELAETAKRELSSTSEIRLVESVYPYNVFEIEECMLDIRKLSSIGFVPKFQIDKILGEL